MRVEELIIDGFKSYATRTVISDWDRQFNAITGLNGSGKSNILDAICFVLGITSMATVRAQNLQDLIYKRGQAGVVKASVTIVFDNTDVAGSPIGFESYPKISVTRQIALGGTSKYLINGHRAQQQTVLHLFQSVQLNINNPNFLIMQGKITKLLNMKPTEILSLIEEAAGTRMFEDMKEKAMRIMAKKETKLQENRTLLEEEIKPKLNKFRNEERAFIEFQETQNELEKLLQVVSAYDYRSLVTKNASTQEVLEQNAQRTEELQIEIERYKSEINSLNEDFAAIKKQKELEFLKDGAVSTLEKHLNELSTELSRLSTNISIAQDDLKEEETNVLAIKKALEVSRAQLESKSKEYNMVEKDYNELSVTIESLKSLYADKEELLSSLATGLSSKGSFDGGYNAQLSLTKSKINDAQVSIKQSHMRINMLEKELASNEPLLLRAKKDNAEKHVQLEDSKKKKRELESKLEASGFNPKVIYELKNKETQLNKELYELTADAERLKRKVANLEFNYSKSAVTFDPKCVKGLAAQVFTLEKENFGSANALQVCAGGRLFNVIVDTEHTASELLEKGGLRKRVTIIPLNKISTRVIGPSTLEKAKQLSPGNVELALDLIVYEPEVSKAMEYIFGNSLICKHAETAKMVTFNPQIRARSITLDGDIYDPEGTLSGGSRGGTNSFLIDIQTFNEASRKIKTIEKELEHIHSQQVEYENASKVTRSLQNELRLVEHKLQLEEKAISSNPSVELLRKNEEMQREITSCAESITCSEHQIVELQAQLVNIQKDMEEFNADKGVKLQQLQQQLTSLGEEIKHKEEENEKKYDLYQSLQMETDQLQNDINSLGEEVIEKESQIKTLHTNLKLLRESFSQKSSEMETVKQDLTEARNRLIEMYAEMKEMESLLKKKNSNLTKNELEVQKLSHEIIKLTSAKDVYQQQLQELTEEHKWLEDDIMVSNIINQNTDANLNEYRERVKILEEKFQGMKRKVNPNVMSIIESVEKEERKLQKMIDTIEEDKNKIIETMKKLNGYKRETLMKTWQKVNVDFGNIFADLLPKSFAKLVPVEGSDISAGLEVKVKLGSIWKESLVELSGGQRSLIALSLILALLQFKPAPMYILDEVDAALDLSHTQNIGHLIKTRFKGSQFIVVSLKEGMFTNANRIFRTRFQEGTSVVSIM
ncbi:HDL078Wp [Eremothecium sinecaudum]|uniref:Structural maintenance of chromosomes protein n=1 Tax=Eremothecium sinecaudum TaxID=45286 RepID=A0A0X8HRP5_9SACH|nr:HDL078Wp [Eremothecium sinecaudum]AMD20666.1 HDL078Wp [Eremothecium sinecaudum]